MSVNMRTALRSVNSFCLLSGSEFHIHLTYIIKEQTKGNKLISQILPFLLFDHKTNLSIFSESISYAHKANLDA